MSDSLPPLNCSTPGFPVFHYHLPEFAQIHVHRVGDAIQPSHPLSPPFPLALNLSPHQALFQWVTSLHQVAKVLKLQLQHQPLQWILELISFRIDWLDLLAVQGTLKSLVQHHSSKASIFRHSGFFTVQLSHPYMTMEFHKFPNPCFYFFCRFFCVCFYHFEYYHSKESQGKIHKC